MERYFTRFGAFAQRVSSIAELQTIYHGTIKMRYKEKLKDAEPLVKELADIEDLRNHLHTVVALERFDKHFELEKGVAYAFKETYKSEAHNPEFGWNDEGSRAGRLGTDLSGLLASLCFTRYATNNMRSFATFNQPKVNEGLKRISSDIRNYLSFKGYSTDSEPGSAYIDLVNRVDKSVKKHTGDLFKGSLDMVTGYEVLIDVLEEDLRPRGLKYLAGKDKVVPEDRIRRILDAMVKKVGYFHMVPYDGPSTRFFIPWMEKPGSERGDDNLGPAAVFAPAAAAPGI